MTLEEQLEQAVRERDEWKHKWGVAIQAWEIVSTELGALKATKRVEVTAVDATFTQPPALADKN